MAESAKLFSKYHLNAGKKLISDLSAAVSTIKVSLHMSSFTPNQDSMDNYGDLTNEVANGNGYTTGGAALANKTFTQSGMTTRFDADDIEWANATITARYAVIRDATPAAAADQKVLAYVDFGVDKSSSGVTFKITWASEGIFTHTVA
ncbi:MAG: hypothetical protein PHO26_10085 [Dehalococcoidia bacterium]|nr:hypothetical protein [Dehalococcoidia bacterium]MDD5494285.1 hypothetical protein [Dehalococcoidia bacterium]